MQLRTRRIEGMKWVRQDGRWLAALPSLGASGTDETIGVNALGKACSVSSMKASHLQSFRFSKYLIEFLPMPFPKNWPASQILFMI
ncbi:hypothetical protein GOZ78_13750 [Agrobacterium vitis]|uniref:Uncharacterized protein n=1 Tax=Agrobacterium vitis TaxID=373 RepID=A0ABD6G5P1_AGRVI|nr:hypothetical protein [Agrobacterium vitis]MUO79930.1 hypothetical protein [Agrobacterium vitis]MUO93581.1 hypothetical protein [Agrobacterium vitis]MUP04168.1 hypothetical protein [Agrobacterium vitis]MUZ84348.1 hypothetical protein [Agrobacterium vitis]MVA11091.1 hypothetical protein [Agrobacterium vitis]